MATYKTLHDIRLQPLLFSSLTVDDTNFLEWMNDAKVVLAIEGLAAYLSTDTTEGLLDVMKSQILLIFCRHLDPSLQQ